MKRKSILLLIACAMLVFQGCSFPEKNPIEQTQNILIGGIDVEGNDIVLTVYTDTVGGSAKPGDEQISHKLYINKGKTVYEADNSLHNTNEKHLSWFHTKYIIVGEEAAKSGIDRLLSFFTENDETRMLFRVAIVRGTTAKDFLQHISARKDSAADYLDNLFEEVKKTGDSREIHLLNYAINRGIPWNDVFIPTIELITDPVQPAESKSGGSSGGGGQSGGESEKEPAIKLGGFALFSGDKLSGFLDSDQALALNILNNEAKGGVITVTSMNGHNVSLELMRSSANIRTSFYPLSVNIEVNIDSHLVEFHDGDSPYDAESMKYLEQQQNEIVKNRILEAIKRMQQSGSDAADFGDKFYHSDPYKWQDIKDKWKELFPQIQFSIKVDTNIRSTYELKEPVSG